MLKTEEEKEGRTYFPPSTTLRPRHILFLLPALGQPKHLTLVTHCTRQSNAIHPGPDQALFPKNFVIFCVPGGAAFLGLIGLPFPLFLVALIAWFAFPFDGVGGAGFCS